MKNKKLAGILTGFIMLTTLYSLFSGVMAATTLIYKSDSSRFLTGGFASGTYIFINQDPANGYFKVACSGNSYCCIYAYADSNAFTGQTGPKTIEINVQVDSTSSSGTGSHKVHCKFIDITNGQTLFSSTTSDWNVFTGITDIHATLSATLTNGHIYELQVGPYVQTTGSQTAEAIGTIRSITVSWS